MTVERFRELYKAALYPGDTANAYWTDKLRESLTALIECDAMREKAEHRRKVHKGQWMNDLKCPQCKADWLTASWQNWLGRQP